MSKALNVKSEADAKVKVSDIEFVGNGDLWQLMCKASSKSQEWMKSTKVMEIANLGCVLQVTTQQGDDIAEAMVFVPMARVVEDVNGGRRIVHSGTAA